MQTLEHTMDKLSRREKDQWLDEKDRRESLKSLFYFGKFILGFDLEENPHREACDFVQNSGPLSLLLLPRGSFKTTIVSQIYPVWLLIKNPNIRILLDSIVLKNSERNLSVIKGILEHNDRLRYLFGDHKDPKEWRQGEITSAKRNLYRLKEPSIGTSSVDTLEVGPHWDVIIPDDLHNEDNSRTREQIDKVYEHWRLLFSLLEPNSTMRMVGTRWADLDVYGRIIERHKKVKTMVRRAIKDDGSLYFPTRLTHEVLEHIREQEGIDMFSCQYLNEPTPQGEAAKFRKDWFQYGENTEIPLYITVDPSIGSSPDSDHFAIAVGGISPKNSLFVEHYEFGHWQPYLGIDKIFKIYDFYTRVKKRRVVAIGIEVNAFQKMLKFAFEVEMRKRNKFIKIIELRHTKSKEQRVLALNPRYEAKAVFHKPWMRDGELEEELIKFPRGRRDDVCDAVASLLEIIPTRSQRISKRTLRERLAENVRKEPLWNFVSRYKQYMKKKRRRVVHETLGDNF